MTPVSQWHFHCGIKFLYQTRVTPAASVGAFRLTAQLWRLLRPLHRPIKSCALWANAHIGLSKISFLVRVKLCSPVPITCTKLCTYSNLKTRGWRWANTKRNFPTSVVDPFFRRTLVWQTAASHRGLEKRQGRKTRMMLSTNPSHLHMQSQLHPEEPLKYRFLAVTCRLLQQTTASVKLYYAPVSWTCIEINLPSSSDHLLEAARMQHMYNS